MNINPILQKLKIEALNDMQRKMADTVLYGDSDVVLLSPTGSGKTLAYLLPLVSLLDASNDDVQALVVVPGRELALQTDTVLKSMGCGLRSQSCYGGRPTMDEHRIMKELRPQIVFGTPGRLNDHIDKGNLSPYGVRFLVIDEFDKCLEMGFHNEMERLIRKLPGLRRRFLLSATNAEQIPHFVQMKRAEMLDYQVEEEQVPSRVTLYQVPSPIKDKLETLKVLLLSLGSQSSIVFLNYRESVERVGQFLSEHGFSVSVFHGGLDQRQREDALYLFSNGSANVLVSTDLASRGLDIPNIANIIHYHLPESEDGYVHRVGRTARWDKNGCAYFILNPEEQLPSYVDGNPEILTLLPKEGQTPPQPKMATLYIGKGKKDKISKGDIVGFLCKKGGLSTEDIGHIDVKDRYSYVAVAREKMKQVLRQTVGEKIKGIKTIVEPVHQNF